MDPSTRTFNQHRPRLFGIAYRMLGSVAEAEEVVQDAWLRWHQRPADELDSNEAWLVTVATRLSIDRLRAAKVQRDAYAGIWLPEPLFNDAPTTPEQLLERADDVSIAFLRLLERLSPEARAAFLLREVFDVDYEDVARILDKSEPSCRQLVRRAKSQLADARPRYVVAQDTHLRLLRTFAQALTARDFGALKTLLAESAELIGDGGGKLPSFPHPVVGAQRIAQLLYATSLRYKSGHRLETAIVNGQWGLLRFIEGALESVQAYETDGRRIVRIHVQRNPEKLARIVDWQRCG